MKFGKSHRGVSRTLLLSFVGLGIVVVLAFALTIKLLGPGPPRVVVIGRGGQARYVA